MRPRPPSRLPKRSAHLVDLPESRSYRIKRKLLGPPLDNADLEHERLGIPTGLAVFASDNVSSVAYATEEILHVLIPVVGVLAFSLVMPITVAMCLVLFVLILSYRQTIKEYPTAGGAYMVTRDNFGLFPAQIAGVSLLTDYILTVSVSTAAGTAALASFFPALTPYSVADRDRVRRPHRLRQPEGRQGLGQGLRRPDLLLRRDDGDHARRRLLEVVQRRTPRAGHLEPHRGDRHRPGRATSTPSSTAPRSSSCSTPSPPAARP